MIANTVFRLRPGLSPSTARLGILANDAQLALARVSSGETTAIDGWLAYGAALNEGRALFPGKVNDRAFGEWCAGITSSNLEDIHPAEQSAAMWAAREPEQFETARASGNARTMRGIYDRWNIIDADRKAALHA